jgi:TonB family protein
MGYQALLFCPDEKTARTVTQVLGELDFIVVPCTEPFAAVKKLMGERFDAVVVDCDNEQNATLLFKSARNTPENQSALAVAVVEGQAGVAKAFRIGANLVLTKPLNVELAKGTLRVARGLLRKNEAAKVAPKAASPAVKPAAAAPLPPKPAPQRPVVSADKLPTAAPVAPLATASIPTPKPPAQPSITASAAHDSTGDDDIFEVSVEGDSPSSATPAAQWPLPKIALLSSATTASQIELTSQSGFGTASAPAPAREAKPKVSTGDKSLTEKVAFGDSDSPAEEASFPAPAFTFGGNVDETRSSRGGSMRALVAVAAVVVFGAIGYAAWMEWGRSSDRTNVPAHVAAQPATTPAAVQQVTTNAAVPSSAPSSVQTSIADTASAPRPNGTAKTSADTRNSANVENAPSHSNKSGNQADLSKPSASLANKAPAPKEETEQPIVIKSGSARPAVRSAATPDAPAPSLSGIAPASNAAPLPNLMDNGAKTPTPVLQTLSVSQGVSQGLLVKKVQPTYPPNALRLRLEGAVLLSATISKNGDISAVKILSGEPQLAHAAVDAVKQWKYKPYLLNGSPVEIQTQVTVNFKVPH